MNKKEYTLKSDSFGIGYITLYIKDDTLRSLMKRTYEYRAKNLGDLLPHGSGINYDWSITQQKSNPNRFVCSNSYDAMDEMGGYCHIYDFSVIVDYNETTGKFEFVRFSFHGQREYSCCGCGLVEYLEQTIYEMLDYNQN